MLDSTCKCRANDYFPYYNTSLGKRECVHCHPLCLTCMSRLNNECFTCDPSVGGTLVAPNTCGCYNRFYYEEELKRCVSCSYLCGNCYGPRSDQCFTCSITSGYLVIDKPNVCVGDCDVLGGYYRDISTCKRNDISSQLLECNPVCLSCFGPNTVNCYLCADLSKVTYNGVCMPECQSHYYVSNRMCFSIL